MDALHLSASDPWSDSANRLELANDSNFARLANLLRRYRLQVHLPTLSSVTPSGPRVTPETAEAFAAAPISRVPLGNQAGSPALLDYACAVPGTILSSELNWDFSPADHAWLITTLSTNVIFPRKPKSCWTCKNYKHCGLELNAIWSNPTEDLSLALQNLRRGDVNAWDHISQWCQ